MDRALDGEPAQSMADGGWRMADGPNPADASIRNPNSAIRNDRPALNPISELRNPKLPADAEELEEESLSETEPDSGRASAVSMGDALAPNVLLLPPPAVVIPFPVGRTVEGGGSISGMDSSELDVDLAASGLAALEQAMAARAGAEREARSAEGSAFRAPPFAHQQDGGLDVTRLKLLPVETEESTSDNIMVVDFRPPAEAKIIRLPLAGPLGAERGVPRAAWDGSALPGAPALFEVSEEAATSQLPGGEVSREEIAHLPPAESPGVGLPENSKGVGKVIAHGGLPRADGAAELSAEGTGISAARQEGRMDSMKHSEQGNGFAGQGRDGAQEFPPPAAEPARAELKPAEVSARFSGAMDWQLGRPVGRVDRPSPAAAALTPEQSATADRVSSLILRETSLVRQYSSDSMAVVLRPDDSTELYVHFAQRNGQIEATIRCDRGDAQQLGALWPQLQESLAQQRVRLAPLQEGAAAHSNFNHSAGFGSSQDGSGSQRQSPADQQSMDERSAPASSFPDVPHARGRGGSRRRLTTSRPGWETWA